jgi:hypothetical protein
MLEWLEDEWNSALTNVRPRHLEWLRQRGVSPEALENVGGFGVLRAEVGHDSWRPDPEGVPVIVLPAFSADRDGGIGPLYDLFAFRPLDEGAPIVTRRRLDAVWIGEPELELCAFLNLPPTVRFDVLSWMRAGGRGIVPVDDARAYERLASLQAIEAETPEIAEVLLREIRSILLAKMPRVTAPGQGKRR